MIKESTKCFTNVIPMISQESKAFLCHYLVWQGAMLHHNVSAGVILSNQSLVLQKLRREASGKYVCSATNLIGTGKSEPKYLNIKCESHETVTAQLLRWWKSFWNIIYCFVGHIQNNCMEIIWMGSNRPSVIDP